MEVQELVPVVLMFVLVGMVLGVGLITFDKTWEATPEKVTNQNVTISNVVNESTGANLISGYGNLTSWQVYNNSGELVPASFYEVWEDSDTKYYLNTSQNSSLTADSIYVILDFNNYDTSVKTVMESNVTEVGGISNVWLGLLITIVALAIILTFVVRSFAGRN